MVFYFTHFGKDKIVPLALTALAVYPEAPE
jgi:hypothetical protein